MVLTFKKLTALVLASAAGWFRRWQTQHMEFVANLPALQTSLQRRGEWNTRAGAADTESQDSHAVLPNTVCVIVHHCIRFLHKAVFLELAEGAVP